MLITLCFSFLSHAGKDEFLAEVRLYQKNSIIINYNSSGRMVYALRKDASNPKTTFAFLKESKIQQQEFISSFAKQYLYLITFKSKATTSFVEFI